MRQKEKKAWHQQEKNHCKLKPPRVPDNDHTGTVGLCLSTVLGSSNKAASSYSCYSASSSSLMKETIYSFLHPSGASVLLNMRLGFVWGFFSNQVKQLRVSGIGSVQILLLWPESNHSNQCFYISKSSLCHSDCQKLFMASWLPCSQGCVQQCLVSVCFTISFRCYIPIADAKATLVIKKAVFLPPKLRN